MTEFEKVCPIGGNEQQSNVQNLKLYGQKCA